MNELREIIGVIGLKKIVLALVAFVVGNTLLYFLAIRPFDNPEAHQVRKLEQLTESYIRMKSADYTRLVAVLKQQTVRLEQKENLLQKAKLSEEAIPPFVSKLEREAIAAGLEIKTNLHRKQGKRKSAGSGELNLTLSFNGTYLQAIAFFKRLENWPGPVFVSSFRLKKMRENGNQISGEATCRILERESH